MTANEEHSDIARKFAEIDRLVHEPSRLLILSLLYVVKKADYTFLMQQSGLTWGNLASHLSKLEEAGYLVIEKRFAGKKPQTMLSLTNQGRKAFSAYRDHMTRILDAMPEQEK